MNIRKKVTMVIMVLTTVCSLTGCMSSKERSDIIDKLKSKSIIKRDWELLDEDAVSAAPIPGVSYYNYIYNTGDYEEEEYSDKNGKTEVEYDEGVAVVSIRGKDSETGVYDISITYEADVRRYFNEYERNGKQFTYDSYEARLGETAEEYHVKYFKFLWMKELIMTDEDGNWLGFSGSIKEADS